MDLAYLYHRNIDNDKYNTLHRVKPKRAMIGRPLTVGVGYSNRTYPLPRVYIGSRIGSPSVFNPLGIKPFLSPKQRAKLYSKNQRLLGNPHL